MVYKKKTANWPGFVYRLLGHVIIYLLGNLKLLVELYLPRIKRCIRGNY